MELPSPLRWLGAIAIMVIVVLIAVPMLINTIGETVRLSTGASEDPLASESPSGAASEAEGDGEGGGGDDEGDFPQDYTVADGDTGEDISEQFYGNPDGWRQIAEANDIDPSDPLQAGMELEIPAPEE